MSAISVIIGGRRGRVEIEERLLQLISAGANRVDCGNNSCAESLQSHGVGRIQVLLIWIGALAIPLRIEKTHSGARRLVRGIAPAVQQRTGGSMNVHEVVGLGRF